MAHLQSQLASERERIRRLEDQLRNLADHDPVTDLLNRRSFEQALEDHLQACCRYGPAGAFLLVRLDGLDQVARTFGHRAADELLAGLAEVLAENLLGTDVAGRWAPDELAILLPRAGHEAVTAIAGSLVRMVSESSTCRTPAGSVTASVGVALVSAPVVHPIQLVRRARGALDVAKRRGSSAWAMAGLEAMA